MQIYDWRRVGLIDVLSEALGDVSGVSVEQCRKAFSYLTTEQLEAAFVSGFQTDLKSLDQLISI